MDFLLALTAGLWALGGAASSAWIFWLDRDRSEFGAPVKLAALFGWPVLLPALLWRREDLGGFEAARAGTLATLLLALGPVSSCLPGLNPAPPARVAAMPVRHATSREPLRKVQPAPPFEFIAKMEVNEDDRRRAQAHWNAGIVFFQKGDYALAQAEWVFCRRLDPGNSDCADGLSRADLIVSGRATVDRPSEGSKREAVRYWNSGIIFYQRGDYARAAEEWKTCRRLDPANSDCTTGLKRIAQSYGGDSP